MCLQSSALVLAIEGRFLLTLAETGDALVLTLNETGPTLGLLATFDDHAASRNRWASRSSLARPYIWRLIVFSRLIWPSTCPVLHGSVAAVCTAASSAPSRLAKPRKAGSPPSRARQPRAEAFGLPGADEASELLGQVERFGQARVLAAEAGQPFGVAGAATLGTPQREPRDGAWRQRPLRPVDNRGERQGQRMSCSPACADPPGMKPGPFSS
jgi:hypothetical protein